MMELLKRLQMVKHAIELDDKEIISLQLPKLHTLNHHESLSVILHALEQGLYAQAREAIESYLTQAQGIVVYEDGEFNALKKELKVLEEKLQEKLIEKTEYLTLTDEFNTQYNLHLGKLIKSILELRKEILYKKTVKYHQQKRQCQEEEQGVVEAKSTIEEMGKTIKEFEALLESMDEENENYGEIKEAYDELKEELEKLYEALEEQEKVLEEMQEVLEDDDELFDAYEEAKAHYEEFENEYESIKEFNESLNTLNIEETQELKVLYKKAARLCHPDIVPDELKEQANLMMQTLNDAYSKKELSKVKEIFYTLKKGTGFALASDKIEDIDLLKEKIDEIKQKIDEVEAEIEEILEDETYTTIHGLEDWDVYFEELKAELEGEKQKLEKEASEIFEVKKEIKKSVVVVEEWIQNLWKWADENNISNGYLSRQRENLLATTKIDFINLKIKYLPNEICNLENIQELSLWGCELLYLPKDIVKFTNLTKLNLRGNLQLSITNTQKIWLDNLMKKCTVFKEEITIVRDGTLDFAESDIKEKATITNSVDAQERKQIIKIKSEASPYSNHIQSIENSSFEKIRRYCNNLVDDNKADSMQKYLVEQGKMHKALMYDALEQFVGHFIGKTITLIDWGCDQGIASMLVLDYIREKQLLVTVDQIFIVDTEDKTLARAIAQVQALNFHDATIVAIKGNHNLDRLETIQNSITLNLFANDKIPVDYLELDFDMLQTGYFLCVSNTNQEFVDEVYENISDFNDVHDLSIRDCKIGRFEKFERVFRLN